MAASYVRRAGWLADCSSTGVTAAAVVGVVVVGAIVVTDGRQVILFPFRNFFLSGSTILRSSPPGQKHS